MENRVKNKKLDLEWIDKETGRKFPAGVAFYHEDKGEFRLKVDAMPDEKYIFLRPTGSDGETVHYRVDVSLRKEGKFVRSSPIGSGRSSKSAGPYIFMELGPYSRVLALHTEE